MKKPKDHAEPTKVERLKNKTLSFSKLDIAFNEHGGSYMIFHLV